MAEAPAAEVDLSTFGCPLYFVKARQALAGRQPGERVLLRFAAGEQEQTLREGLETDTQHIVTLDSGRDAVRVLVERR